MKDTALTCKGFIKINRLFVNDHQQINVGAKKYLVNMEMVLTRRFTSQLSLLHNVIYALDEEKLREIKVFVTAVSVLTSIPPHSPRIVHIIYLQCNGCTF